MKDQQETEAASWGIEALKEKNLNLSERFLGKMISKYC